MTPSSDPFRPSEGEANPPLSEHAADVQREPEDEALHRARQPRKIPDPIRSAAAEDLCSAIEAWISRHPIAAVTAFFGAGCLAGLCSSRRLDD